MCSDCWNPSLIMQKNHLVFVEGSLWFLSSLTIRMLINRILNEVVGGCLGARQRTHRPYTNYQMSTDLICSNILVLVLPKGDFIPPLSLICHNGCGASIGCPGDSNALSKVSPNKVVSKLIHPAGCT